MSNDDEDEDDIDDYTVYECPGLAPVCCAISTENQLNNSASPNAIN